MLSLDIPDERLRLIYTRLHEPEKKGAGPVHIVLAYYDTPGSDPLVLDDRVPQIRPASRCTELRPVYSFNSQRIWLAGEQASGGYTQPVWQNTLQRARAEGFE